MVENVVTCFFGDTVYITGILAVNISHVNPHVTCYYSETCDITCESLAVSLKQWRCFDNFMRVATHDIISYV